MNIEEIVNTYNENEIVRFLDKIRVNPKEKIYLYGAGAGCQWFIKFANNLKLHIEGIIDKNKYGGIIKEIPIVRIQDAVCSKEEVIILVTALKYREEIKSELNRLNQIDCFIFDPSLTVLFGLSEEEKKEYIIDNWTELEIISNRLNDEISKKTLELYLKGIISSNPDFYENYAEENQYFPDFIKTNLSENEVYVDVGAYTGDSVISFINACNNKYKRIYAFEPDRDSFFCMEKSFADERIKLIPKGCGKENAIFTFLPDLDEGKFVEKSDEGEKIEVVALDDVIFEEVTYIKFDVEGMEMDSLIGCRHLIAKNRPKLAISIYHNIDDLIKCFRYVSSINSDYRFYLRHYWNCCGTDFVLFAI